MTTLRAVLVGATTAGLLGIPGAAFGTAPGPLAAHPEIRLAAPMDSAPQARRVTAIRWMRFGHIHAAGTTMRIVGQVTARSHGQYGALAGAHVRLYRRLDGSSRWVYLGTRATSTGPTPEFSFATVSRQNADYRVAYGGSPRFGSSSRLTWLTVYRLFNGHIADGAGAATYSGHVTPFYTHKSITLQRRTCPACSYRTYRTATTGVNGTFAFKLPAPSHGRWWWRVTAPGTAAFMQSYGGTLSTQLV
jgi:hypothetical protein